MNSRSQAVAEAMEGWGTHFERSQVLHAEVERLAKIEWLGNRLADNVRAFYEMNPPIPSGIEIALRDYQAARDESPNNKLDDDFMSELTLELIARRNNKPTEFETGDKKLTPCPFCWSDDITVFNTEETPDVHRCQCLTCGCDGPWRDTRLNAIAIWNRRGGWEMP